MSARFTSFITALTVFAGIIVTLFIPNPPKALTESELYELEDVFTPEECADVIYAVESNALSSAELNAAICLQGLVNKDKPCMYIVQNGAYRDYLREFEKSGKTIITCNEAGEKWNFPRLIEEFRGYITDGGYTLYSPSEFAEGQNVAFNYATAKGWLAVPESLKETVEAAGLTMKLDLTADEYDYAFQYRHFKALRKYFKKGVIIHVKQAQRGLRDFAVSRGYYICYSENTFEGYVFLSRILCFSGKNTFVLGWCEIEGDTVIFLSLFGSKIIPSDHSLNNSYISNTGSVILKQAHPSAPEADPDKHYVAIEMSDGDNSQWIQNGFAAYYEKISAELDFPMSWTFPLIQREFSPVSAKTAYDAAGEYNSFIGGVSGIGYINPTIFRTSALSRFTEQTASAALKSDINVISILDEPPSDFLLPSFKKKLRYYSRFDNIQGGILMLNYDRYSAGKGMVLFSDGKPFLSVRLSLWYPEGEGSAVPDEWVIEQANIINSLPADIHSINGYTLVNVHPWTINTRHLALFASRLDDHIELVSVEQLLGMIAQNCPHKDASPTIIAE